MSNSTTLQKASASVLAIAVTIHEANRTWCEMHGDTSQPVWGDAPRWQKESAINGVLFHLENPHVGPEASHNSWWEEKVRTGWVYGDVKDPEALPPTHPCMVSFIHLPEFQQAKDRMFRAMVHALRNGEQEDG